MADLTGQQLKNSYQNLVTIDATIESNPTSGQLENGLGNPITALGIGTDSPDVAFHALSSGNTFLKAERTTAGSEGALTLGAQTNENAIYSRDGGTSGRDLGFIIGTATAMTIDSNGDVGIGTDSPASILQIEKNVSNGEGAELRITNDAGATGTGQIATLTIGRDFEERNVKIKSISTNNNGLQPDLVFTSNQSGGGSITHTELVRIKNSGGITFNGDTASANALDDYEEGTFTPKFVSSTDSNDNVTNSRVGYYTKIGNMVYITVNLINNDLSGITGTDQVILDDLPFTAISTISGNDQAVTIGQYRYLATTDHTAIVQNNTDQIAFTTDGFVAATYTSLFSFPGNTSTSIKISAVYQTA